MKSYDHIIIGSGQASGTLLGKLIPTGESIALIEEGKLGGSCVNYGCTPTKTLVASAKAFYQAGRGDFFGFDTGKLKLDYSRVRERMNQVRGASREGLEDWVENTENLDLIRGRAVFEGPKRLRIGESSVEGKKIYINVGTRPRIPGIKGLDQVSWMDNSKILEMEHLPEHLLIIGGGYIGLEFAQVYRRFGSEVTVVQRGDQLMPREDPDVADAIQEFLEEEGINFVMNADARAVSQENGRIKLQVEADGKSQNLEGTDLLIAVGRIPNSDRLNLDAAGIAVDKRGYIEVDEYCRTTREDVFALGDVNGQGAFTHTSVNDAEIVLDHLFGGPRKLSMRNTVYGLFTDPPLGRVGMTEKEALKEGYKVLKASKPMASISRAKEMGETRGFAKLLVDGETDMILGASILGVGGDEVINMFATIIHSQIPCRHYRQVVLVHPTVSELMPWVLDGIEKAKMSDLEEE